jgi:hypothetical protein
MKAHTSEHPSEFSTGVIVVELKDSFHWCGIFPVWDEKFGNFV